MNRTEEKKPSTFLLEVPAAHRKALIKILEGLKKGDLVTEFSELEGVTLAEGLQAQGQPHQEEITRYHDLID